MSRKNIVLLIIVAVVNCGCASFWDRASSTEAVDATIGAVGNILAGNTGAALGQGIDLALILLGFKTLSTGSKKAVALAKKKLVNPVPGQTATEPS